MRVLCGAIGRVRRGPEADLVGRYAERIRAGGRAIGLRGFDLHELDESGARSAEERKKAEAHSLAALIPPGAVVVALDEGGVSLTSPAFAEILARWRDEGRPAAAFMLGGPDGHGDEIRGRADMVLSLGAMTWPHLLARVLLVEQIYRATTILAGHPYHRA